MSRGQPKIMHMDRPAVYRLKARQGAGWVRELVDGRPIVTADPSEAQQWPSAAEARRARPSRWWMVVAGEPSEFRRRGLS